MNRFYIGDINQHRSAPKGQTNYTYVSFELVFWIDDEKRNIRYLSGSHSKQYYYLVE